MQTSLTLFFYFILVLDIFRNFDFHSKNFGLFSQKTGFFGGRGGISKFCQTETSVNLFLFIMNFE